MTNDRDEDVVMPDEFFNTTLIPENGTLINTEFSQNETVSLYTEMTSEVIPEQITRENMDDNSKDSTTSAIFPQHQMYQIYNGPI